MDNANFAIRNHILSTFNSGNVIIDLLIGSILCSLVTSLIGIFRAKDIYLEFKKFFKCKKNSKASIFMEYKKNHLSVTFKAILHYINTRNITKITHINEGTFWKYNRMQNDDDENVYYVPEDDHEYEITNDIFITLGTREKKVEGGNTEIYHELISLELFTYKADLSFLKNFLEKCKIEYEEHIYSTILNKQTLFICSYNSTDKCIDYNPLEFNSNRTFDNLFFDQKNILLKKVNFFLENKDWYATRGIPYTLGILLHGDPGCGKTSFIKALLNYLDNINKKRVHGIYINLDDKFDFDELEELILGDEMGDYKIPRDQRLYIFEDIDCMGEIVKDRDLKNKENEEINKKINQLISNKPNIDIKEQDIVPIIDKNSNDNDTKNSLSRLLNILDGIIETPGRIIIMTTNKLNSLDKALIRPGRIDIKIHFTKCSKKMTQDIINNFYETNISQDSIKNYKEFELTPAELVQKCFECSNSDLLLENLNSK